MTTHSLLLLPGDGIGPEVMRETRRVAERIGQQFGLNFEITEDLVGGAAIDAHGVPLHDDTLAAAKAADAVLLGAVGGPKWDNIDFSIRPEKGLLKLRSELALFANLRPAIVFDALATASSLKTDLVSGLDILIVRELTGGVYFGEPRGISTLPNGEERAVNTQVYDTHEIDRVARVAYDLAGKRQGRLCSVEKANVMETGQLWRKVVTQVGEADFANVELSHMYADNCAMQLVRAPKQFDVIVTDNLFGDLLSDAAAMLTGSLGMLPSASLGAEINGKRASLYEPVHGSAPDIAGQNKANPLATIQSFAMCLRYSFNAGEAADTLENAVKTVLDQGFRTGDIMQPNCTQVSTQGMGEAILSALSGQAASSAA